MSGTILCGWMQCWAKAEVILTGLMGKSGKMPGRGAFLFGSEQGNQLQVDMKAWRTAIKIPFLHPKMGARVQGHPFGTMAHIRRNRKVEDGWEQGD